MIPGTWVGAIVNRLCLSVFLLVGTVLPGVRAFSQHSRHVVAEVLDGRSGEPLSKQRLMVFARDSEEAAKRRPNAFTLTTDEDGLAFYPLPARAPSGLGCGRMG